MSACMYECMYVCMHVCIHVCMSVCMYMVSYLKREVFPTFYYYAPLICTSLPLRNRHRHRHSFVRSVVPPFSLFLCILLGEFNHVSLTQDVFLERCSPSGFYIPSAYFICLRRSLSLLIFFPLRVLHISLDIIVHYLLKCVCK